jgi:hypothetical protein
LLQSVIRNSQPAILAGYHMELTRAETTAI